MTASTATSAVSVLDCHQHHGHLFDDPTSASGADWRREELQARIAAMDALGVHHTLVMPANDYACPNGITDTRRINDGLREYLALRPDRFVAGIGVAEPRHGAVALEEIRRCHEVLGFVGIQYHCRFQGVSIDHPWMFRHLEQIAALGMLAFVHSHADSAFEAPAALGRLASAFPELTIVVLDACSGYRHSLECFDLAERHANLAFDTGLAYNMMPVIQMVERFGAERVLFGSDIYSHPHTFRTSNTPSAIAAAFDPAAGAAILGGNMRRLIAGVLGRSDVDVQGDS